MAIQPPKHVMDLLLDAICVVDRQGRFLSISGACEAIFGYRPEEMVGRSMLDFLYAEDLDRTLQAVARIEAGYQQRHFENRYVRRTAASPPSSGRRACPSARRTAWRWRAISPRASRRCPTKRCRLRRPPLPRRGACPPPRPR